ncbi:hypothetical protein ACEWPM_005125 [Roseovarius sp. S4756]|uniref:hypothetical protein n=1 Tax=Roseovarius maritimus TaxID=3342637 RepID=UPI0037298888
MVALVNRLLAQKIKDKGELGVTKTIAKLLRRRSAIESVIGYIEVRWPPDPMPAEENDRRRHLRDPCAAAGTDLIPSSGPV